jgi:iron(III) transport system substrate-binding protein
MTNTYERRKFLDGEVSSFSARPLLTRRRMLLQVPALLAAPGLLTLSGRAASAAEPADEAGKLAAAKKDGKLTWYISMFDIGTAEDVAKTFENRYPGVAVQVVRATAGVIYQRILQEAQAGVFACDVFSSTEEGQYMDLKDKGLLQPYVPAGQEKIISRFQHIDTGNYYQVASVGLMLIIYNTQHVPQPAAPTSWEAMLDPRWQGKIAMGHPAFSGYVATWVLSLWKLHGWDFFEKLAKLNPLIGRSANDAITELDAGERLVGPGPDGTTLKNRNKGNPINILYPSDSAVLMTSPSAVMAKAPHPAAAKLFMDFFMTKEYSQVLARNGFSPLRADVPTPKGMKPLSEIKLMRPPAKDLKAEIPKAIEKFRATFGV